MKKHILRLALLTVTLTAILTSCGNKTPKDRTQYLPNITGNAGEVLIVINKSYWEGELGSTLREILAPATHGPSLRSSSQYPPLRLKRRLSS